MKQVLKKHNLKHISELRVGKNLLSHRFSSGCSMSNCNGICCTLGVYADLKERDKILDHREMILRYMEPQQEHDSLKWFESEEIEDPDFVSGRSVGTQARDYGCVFLDCAGRCILQKACIAEGLHPYFLKPFYCVAFPVVIDNGELIIDDIELVNRPPCCIISPDGVQDVFDVCKMELEFVLGRDGMEELRQIRNEKKLQ